MAKTLGLEIGERFITLAQVERKNTTLNAEVLAYEQMPLNIYATEAPEAEQQAVSFIQKILKDAAVKLKNTTVVLPDSKSYTRILEMPKLTEKELISALRYQADQFIPIPIDQVSLDIEILYEDDKNKRLMVLLIASANAVIDKITRIVEKVGLIPVSMENEASAALRFINEVMVIPSKTPVTTYTMYMNFGNSSTSLYLIDNARTIPVHTVNFAVGYEIFAKELKTNLSISDQEINRDLMEIGFANVESPHKVSEIVGSSYKELVTETQRFIVSAKERYNMVIDKMYLYGEGTIVRALDTKLATSLGMKIEILNPYSHMVQNNVANFFRNNLPLFVHSISASLRS